MARRAAIRSLAVVLVVVLFAGAAALFSGPAENSRRDVPDEPGSKTPSSVPSPLASPGAGVAERSPAADESDQPLVGQPPFTSPMQAQLQDIASAYRKTSRFPDYSVPLTENDWQLLNPRAFVPRSAAVAGVEDLQVTIELEQYIIDMQRAAPVRVVAQSSASQVRTVNVMLKGAGGVGGPVPLTVADGTANLQVFEGLLAPAELAAAGAGESAVIAQLTLADGETANVAAMVEIYRSEASLVYLGDAYVEGAHLVIPAHFRVNNPGYYRVRANLYEAGTDAPVSHLNSAFMLSENNSTGLLKVHAVTLREMQAPGPYQVTDINIIRSPARPGDTTGYGSSEQPSYPVAGFSLDSYSDEPYVDESVRQRQEFLDALGQTPESP